MVNASGMAHCIVARRVLWRQNLPLLHGCQAVVEHIQSMTHAQNLFSKHSHRDIPHKLPVLCILIIVMYFYYICCTVYSATLMHY